MAHQNTHRGVIITPAARASALADELVALCDWPVLAQPSIRALVEHIELHRPLCSLFWLESANDILPAAALIARLRDRGPRPYRIAVAHSLEASTEHALRTAGIHSYFAAGSNLRALVEDTLLPLVEMHTAATSTKRAAAAATAEKPIRIRAPADPRGSPASTHPP
jgi:hypothetical protein